MLKPGTYRAYYRMARYQSQCSIIELGTGQGASTIALAIGIADAGRDATVQAVDQFYQESDGPHPAGRDAHGDHAADINFLAYRQNLSYFGVESLVGVHRGKTTETVLDREGVGPFDMLVIDVDGYVDRDFSLFFDLVERGGLIVIDDYQLAVNRQGRKNLVRFREKGAEETRRRIENMPRYDRGRLLGKHLLTYRLVKRFQDLGLIRIERDLKGTVVCRKTTTDAFSSRFQDQDAEAIEASIIADFLRLRDSGRNQFITPRFVIKSVLDTARRVTRGIG